jgi:hypothetical protein
MKLRASELEGVLYIEGISNNEDSSALNTVGRLKKPSALPPISERRSRIIKRSRALKRGSSRDGDNVFSL